MSMLSDIMGFVSPIASFASGLLGKAGDAQASAEQMEAQRQWQSHENELSRQFNAEEAQKQRDYESNMWELQNRYNLPSNQVKRLLAAGINPARAMSGGSPPSGNALGVPNGSSATSSPIAANYGTLPTQVGIQSLAAHGGYIRDLSSAVKNLTGSQVDQSTIDKIGQEITNMTSQNRLIIRQEEAQRLANDIVSLTGKKEALQRIKNLIADFNLKVSEKAYNDELTFNEKERFLGIYWDNLSKKMQALLGDTNYKKALIELESYREMLHAGIQESKSRTNKNNAEAAESGARTKTENALRDLRKEAMRLDNDYASETFITRVTQTIKGLDKMELENFSLKLALKDKEAYNALQRLISGHASKEDKSLLVKVFRGISDADMMTGARIYSK